jgi:HSP20 family molecular chaperone IbpA
MRFSKLILDDYFDSIINNFDEDYIMNKEEDNTIIYKFNVAGVDKENIDIHFEKDLLHIAYKDFKDQEKNYYLTKSKYDYLKTEANVVNGLLILKIPLKEEAKPKKIDIN